MSSALCWFQLKGIQSKSSESPEPDSKSARVRLDVEHLRFWYLQPYPTYLALYVEAFDVPSTPPRSGWQENRSPFLVLNLQAYVRERWGQAILTLKQKRVTVEVDADSRLDEQAFQLILRQSQADDWKRLLSTDDDAARLGVRDTNVIWHLGTAKERAAKHRIRYWRWQSKLRAQLWIEEFVEGEWKELREHWEKGLQLETLPQRYPYLEFAPWPEDGEVDWDVVAAAPGPPDDEDEDDEDWLLEYDESALRVPGIGVLRGADAAGEYFEYEIAIRLNDLGQKLFEQVLTLLELGIVEIIRDQQEWISIAPWESRAV